jgi:hypothetical protein
MPEYIVSIEVAAPAERVFAEVSDLTNHATWSADPLEINPTDATPVGPGKTYRSRAISKGKRITADLSVTHYERPTLFEFTASDLTGRYVHRFLLREAGSSTEVERTVTASLGYRQRLLYMLVFRLVKLPNARRAMRLLKERCERQAGG